MNKTIKYMVAGITLILFVLPMSVSSETYPIQDITCQTWGTNSGLFMCWNADGTYNHWFSSYNAMVAFYEPVPMTVEYIPENVYEWTISNLSP